MKKTKWTVPMYSFYDRTHIQNYLQAQAEKGWLVENAGTFAWKFRRIEPQKLRFSVVYFPKADLYDPEPSAQEETFREFCEHSGWHFAAAQAQMQIFYNESPDPVPIDTDPEIEVENIHKSMKKSLLPGYWLMILASLLQIASQCLGFFTNPVNYLSHNINLYFLVFWPSMLVLCILRLALYYRWRGRAMEAAEEGQFLETRSIHQKIEQWWAIAALVWLVAMVLLGRSEVTTFGVIFGVIVGFGIIATQAVLRSILKKRGCDARRNKKISIIATLVVTFVLIAVSSWVAVAAIESGAYSRKREVPVKLSELVDLGGEECEVLVMEDGESLLLGQSNTLQYAGDWLSDRVELSCSAVYVKAGFLYDFCLQKEMETGLRHPMTETDPTPWQAEMAWILGDQGYMLCYEDYIVTLWPEWEMTEEQMSVVGNAFN